MAIKDVFLRLGGLSQGAQERRLAGIRHTE
jgi:hypothetical protein